MTDPLERDFFIDPELMRDPTPYYAALRERGPVVREPHHGVFMVSGIDEVLAVYAATGPLSPGTALRPRARRATFGPRFRGARSSVG